MDDRAYKLMRRELRWWWVNLRAERKRFIDKVVNRKLLKGHENAAKAFEIMVDEQRAEMRRVAGAAQRLSRAARAERAASSSSTPAHGWAALRWSEEKPKRHGWWWVEMSNGAKQPIYVDTITAEGVGRLYAEFDRRLYRLSAQLFLRWAGPLVEPEEPSDAQSPPNH